MFNIWIYISILFLSTSAYALNFGDACDPELKYSKSGAFVDNCDNVYLYCNSTSNQCDYKDCSNSDYIDGWDENTRNFPKRCGDGFYCPDNGSRCLPTASVGSQCELMRDDECDAWNSICLNSTCFIRGAPLGGNCGSETTTFTSYLTGGEEFLQTTVRDNCTSGTYCDVTARCIPSKELGSTCTQDRECVSEACSNGGMCVLGPDVFHKIEAWTWSIIAAAIVIFIVLVMVSLWFLHRFQSKNKHAKLVEFFDKYAMVHDSESMSSGDQSIEKILVKSDTK